MSRRGVPNVRLAHLCPVAPPVLLLKSGTSSRHRLAVICHLDSMPNHMNSRVGNERKWGSLAMKKYALISGKHDEYRYWLRRTWGDGDNVCFVMLNPSIADHKIDDPTIRRCIAFGKRWGYGGLVVVNLFAYRTKNPSVLKEKSTSVDVVGPRNDDHLIRAAKRSAKIVLAWGNSGSLLGRGKEVADTLASMQTDALHCLAQTKRGHPFHPLYVPANKRLVRYAPT